MTTETMKYAAMVRSSDGWHPTTMSVFASMQTAFDHLSFFYGDKPPSDVGVAPVRDGERLRTIDPADPEFVKGSEWDGYKTNRTWFWWPSVIDRLHYELTECEHKPLEVVAGERKRYHEQGDFERGHHTELVPCVCKACGKLVQGKRKWVIPIPKEES